MFRTLGDLIHRTSWLAVIVGGVSILIGLVLFAVPIHLLRLSDAGRTPQEKSAIKREINLAFGDRALTIAESVVKSMKSRSADPERVRDLDAALAEMERARRELQRAHAGIGARRGTTAAEAALEARAAANEANDAALETAKDSARSALEAAVDAREAIEQTRNEALTRLRERGVDTTATKISFDELLKSAQDSEQNARESLAAINALPRFVEPPPPPMSSHPSSPKASKAAPGPNDSKPGKNVSPHVDSEEAAQATEKRVTPGATAPTGATPAGTLAAAAAGTLPAEDVPAADGRKTSKPKIEIHFGSPGLATSGPMLPPDVRRDIRAKVAGDVWRVGVGSALILLYVPLFMMVLTAKYLIGRSRRALAFAEEKKREAKVSDVSRQITEARLQALQAQVEPHFLYNTLANVQALTEFDPPAANAMVGHLIQYLRAALPKMRESTSTVGQEVELVRAYLNILKMRMGARLEFGIDVPPDLLTRPFPPMMLPSLVENAIKHGLEPLREGGRIDVIVSRVNIAGTERIRIEVRDNGRGLSNAPIQVGSGIGLANLRERLDALHGGNAHFSIGSNSPQGVVATIVVPLQDTGGSANTSATAAVAATSATSATSRRGWHRAWRATSKTHTAWASIVSKLFFVLMLFLAIGFALSLIALYSGWIPIDIGDLRLEGIEGMALGSVMLLVVFIVAVVMMAILVGVFYGLGFLFAALLIIVPAIIVASLFPFLAPFMIVGFAIYWFWRRWKRKRAPAAPIDPTTQ